MLENFAVFIDYFNDVLVSSDVVAPVAIAILVGAMVIFAWRSTEGNFFNNIKILKNTCEFSNTKIKTLKGIFQIKTIFKLIPLMK